MTHKCSVKGCSNNAIGYLVTMSGFKVCKAHNDQFNKIGKRTILYMVKK